MSKGGPGWSGSSPVRTGPAGRANSTAGTAAATSSTGSGSAASVETSSAPSASPCCRYDTISARLCAVSANINTRDGPGQAAQDGGSPGQEKNSRSGK